MAFQALICPFLFGGADHNAILPPYDQASHDAYSAARPALARPRSEMLPLGNPDAEGRELAFGAQMTNMHGLYSSGDLAVVANVGTLIRPVTKTTYEQTFNRPAQLFSHNDQQTTWQTFGPEGTITGWLGRMADHFLEANGPNSVYTSISANGNAVMMAGDQATQFQVSPPGPSTLITPFGSSELLEAVKASMTAQTGGMFAEAQAQAAQLAFDANGALAAAIAAEGVAPQVTWPSTTFGAQLKVVTEMIAAGRNQLGLERMVFFVGTGGFDTHALQATLMPNLLTHLDTSLGALSTALQQLGVWDEVTVFTASEFGRTLPPNRDGTDHGWGSHHMVMGGSVQGGQVYGTLPEVADDGPDDVERGRLIPTTSVDQYAATLGLSMGVEQAALGTFTANLSEFETSDLGFMTEAVENVIANFSWQAPVDDGGRPITAYEIEQANVGADDWAAVTNATINGLTVTAPVISRETGTRVRVVAVNSLGRGAPSTEIEVYPAPDPTPAGSEILFVTDNVSALSVHEQAAVDRIEGMGHTVTLRSSTTAPDKAADEAAFDLIYLQGIPRDDIRLAAEGVRYYDSALPKFVAEPNLWLNNVYKYINVNFVGSLVATNTGYIANGDQSPIVAGVPQGGDNVLAFASPEVLSSLAYKGTAEIIPGADVLVTTGKSGNGAGAVPLDRWFVVALDAGLADDGGVPLPARAFMWGAAAHANFTATAWTIFDRSFEWTLTGSVAS